MANQDALNYPYIRVRSADWLKRTLLIFPHVARMSPFENIPADDPEIEPFCWTSVNGEPLLRRADLWRYDVLKAQEDLVAAIEKLIDQRGKLFLKGLQKRNIKPSESLIQGQFTLWEERLREDRRGFQIHGDKLWPELVRYLRSRKLAWEPEEGYWHGPEYVEMNPRLGEAVMATLATACAESEGLRVVTEFPKLHGKLAGTPRDQILEASFGQGKPDGTTSGAMIMEFLVYKRCDVSQLTPQRIAALKSEKDALSDFRNELETLATRDLPPSMLHEGKLEDKLQQAINSMFDKWRGDQKNLTSFAREVFGGNVWDEPIKVVGKLIGDLAKPDVAGAGVIGGGSAFGLGAHVLTSVEDASLGLAVAVVVRAAKAWDAVGKRAETSPYRYLTALQDQGVSFQLVG